MIYLCVGLTAFAVGAWLVIVFCWARSVADPCGHCGADGTEAGQLPGERYCPACEKWSDARPKPRA